MRFRNLQTRVAALEKLLGTKIQEAFSEFDRRVTLWLLAKEEYRNLTRRIFDRGCEQEEQVTEESFRRIITPEERERLVQLNKEAAAAVRAELRRQ